MSTKPAAPRIGRLTPKYRAIAWIVGRTMSPPEVVGPERARQDLLKTSTGSALLVGRRPQLASISDGQLAGVDVRRYRPHDQRPGTIAFFHGGGWTAGGIDTHDILAASLAARTGHEVVSVEYRLAPEHRFPAGLDDGLAVVEALLDDGHVAVAGDSAGGNLAAVIAQRLPVRAQLLMYPVVDAAEESDSYRRYGSGHLLTSESMRYFRDEYVPEASRRRDPAVSPLRAEDLRGAAPAYITLAQCDVVHDEGAEYAARLERAGVEVTLDDVPGVPHGFMSMLGFKEAQQALSRCASWLQDRLGGPDATHRR